MPLHFYSQPPPLSTFVEFVVAATDCTAQGATDPAKCNLLAEKVSGPHPGALATWQAWIQNKALLCSLHLRAEGRKFKKKVQQCPLVKLKKWLSK